MVEEVTATDGSDVTDLTDLPDLSRGSTTDSVNVRTIALGCDHAGFKYKELIKAHLEARGIRTRDFGTDSEAPCDYPDFVLPVAMGVRDGLYDRGIVIGGSGNGEAIACNRFRGIRCCLAWNLESAEFARRHNDANVLSLGQRMISEDQVLRIVDLWLTTPFEGGRHRLRLEKIAAIVDR